MQLSDFAEKYIKYQNQIFSKTQKDISFLLIDNKYYMFYNETSLVNPNNLSVCFKYDGIIKNKVNVYYFVAFDNEQKPQILDKLNKYFIFFFFNF